MDELPQPRRALDDRMPPSQEECWEAFWEIWVEGLVDAHECGLL